MEYIFDSGWYGIGPTLVFDFATNPPGQQLLTEEQAATQQRLGSASGGTGRRPATTTRFKPFGPRVHLDVPPEDNWPAPPAPKAPVPVRRTRQARAVAPVLPARAMPPLMRPQVAPAPPPPTPGEAVNAFLATLNELARAAGLDQDAIATLQSVDAIDVSDVFNDMRQ